MWPRPCADGPARSRAHRTAEAWRARHMKWAEGSVSLPSLSGRVHDPHREILYQPRFRVAGCFFAGGFADARVVADLRRDAAAGGTALALFEAPAGFGTGAGRAAGLPRRRSD